MWSIRLIRDVSLGIPWIGSGAAGKAAFMLVTEVSVREDMMMPCSRPVGSLQVVKVGSMTCLVEATSIGVV